jgi:hypothetical protein
MITEGWSRLVRIPALHAGGHGFKSHSLHVIHGYMHTLCKEKNKDYKVGSLASMGKIRTMTITATPAPSTELLQWKKRYICCFKITLGKPKITSGGWQ